MIAGASIAAGAILADGDSDFGAGFVAFLVVVALCVASYFLFRSMNKHLKGLPAHFPPPTEESAAAAGSSDTPREPDVPGTGASV